MADFEPFAFDPTAFMSGQIGSKVWMCEKLEPILLREFDREVVVWLLGGWYAMSNFLLGTRGIAPIHHTVSYDLDPQAQRGALILNENFQYRRKFYAEVTDVNDLNYVDRCPDVVINTSTEHMESQTWYHIIPTGTICVFQTNNMPHEQHVSSCDSVDQLVEELPLSRSLYRGYKTFNYPDWSFTRFMHIGYK